ncbi:MAG: hypothetical protein ACTS7I_02895 [Candidatus Hodgkinia cicadicola]
MVSTEGELTQTGRFPHLRLLLHLPRLIAICLTFLHLMFRACCACAAKIVICWCIILALSFTSAIASFVSNLSLTTMKRLAAGL